MPRRYLFVAVLLALENGAALPTGHAHGTPEDGAAKGKGNGGGGLLSAAGRFFRSFHKTTSHVSNAGMFNMGPAFFLSEYQDMVTWYCGQPGTSEKKMCRDQATAKGKGTGKQLTPFFGAGKEALEVKTQYCATTKGESTTLCKIFKHVEKNKASKVPKPPLSAAAAGAAYARGDLKGIRGV